MINLFDFKLFLKTVTNNPGVYRMYDSTGTVIYVGKAKNLKKRLSSYFHSTPLLTKTKALVSLIAHIDITITNTETEALLLELNYIKLYQPRYNVLLRDDKSYPFIFLSADIHPRLTMYRGVKHIKKGEYFGPFPNCHVVRAILAFLQKIFPIRQCDDNDYRNRKRPCLQYQIKRCLGPCVKGLVSEEEYAQQVAYIRLFLSGKEDQVLRTLISRMEKASQSLAFEEASRILLQIQSVRQITKKQCITNTDNDLDVISIVFDAEYICIYILFVRKGKVVDSQSYFLEVPDGSEPNEIVETFIHKFYLHSSHMYLLPHEILLDSNIDNKICLVNSLSKLVGPRVNIQTKPHSILRAQYLRMARINAASSLTGKRLLHSTIYHQRMTALANLFKLPAINRVECFDISHMMGEQTVAACVVFDAHGPLRSEYRRYNITGITPGDDYAAMKQVLYRRYSKTIEKDKIPDVILIDGGKGHIRQAKAVFTALDVSWDKYHPLLLSVAKGSIRRKTGVEILFLESTENGFSLPADSPALNIIQYIRNESHNYAIRGHRKKLAKVKNTSILEIINGIGPKRRQILLKYMGGLQGLLDASIEEITKVPGISQRLAEKIYYSLKH